MSRRDSAALVALSGLAALAASLSGAVLDYLRPGMRNWVGVAGTVLLVIGGVDLWRSRGERAAHQHGATRVGWLLAIPICIAVTVGSGSLGVYAVGHNGTFRDLPDAPTDFDLEQYVRAASFGGQPIELTMVDLVTAAHNEGHRAILADHQIEVTGFIARDDDGQVRLARFVISCCAADAQVVQVVLDADEVLPDDGVWLELIGHLPAGPATGQDDSTTFVVDTLRAVPEPRLPYEVPFSRIR